MNVANIQQLSAPPEVPSWVEDPRTRALQERLATAERQLREMTEPLDVERAQRMERMLVEVLEWLDSMMQTRDTRLGWFVEALAGTIREVLYGPPAGSP